MRLICELKTRNEYYEKSMKFYRISYIAILRVIWKKVLTFPGKAIQNKGKFTINYKVLIIKTIYFKPADPIKERNKENTNRYLRTYAPFYV